jgi:hypothetical protein
VFDIGFCYFNFSDAYYRKLLRNGSRNKYPQELISFIFIVIGRRPPRAASVLNRDHSARPRVAEYSPPSPRNTLRPASESCRLYSPPPRGNFNCLFRLLRPEPLSVALDAAIFSLARDRVFRCACVPSETGNTSRKRASRNDCCRGDTANKTE